MSFISLLFLGTSQIPKTNQLIRNMKNYYYLAYLVLLLYNYHFIVKVVKIYNFAKVVKGREIGQSSRKIDYLMNKYEKIDNIDASFNNLRLTISHHGHFELC